MQITEMNNFCRVFELPRSFSSEFCFAGGIPTMFKMVDWFNPYCGDLPCTLGHTALRDHREMLTNFVAGKPYTKEGFKYIIITDYGDVMIVDKCNCNQCFADCKPCQVERKR